MYVICLSSIISFVDYMCVTRQCRMKSPTVQFLFLCLGFCAVNSSYNVAFHKPSWVSSTWNPAFKAENVVDGTKYKDRATILERCVHNMFEPFPRWWVNLTGDYTISRIDIDYRHTTRPRMKGYKLIISDTESRNKWGDNHQIEGHICRDETRRTPPAQQMVPCLARGRFITYADNEGPDGEMPVVELCELEAYGCLTGWFGQDNCSEPCPDGCWDRVCNPDNGTCFAGCESGLQGDICDTACSQGTFGFGCQQFCFCDGDTCEPQTGTCPSGRCQRGWNGTACNQRCGEQTFGQNCEETCHCQQGSCDPVNGICLNEGCEPGWQTESCSEECDKGTFGYECNFSCGDCRHNGPCDHVTGQCHNGCSNGWTTAFCNESCPIGTFGFNCTGKCFCKKGTCDPTNGFCSDNACDIGWNGPTCSSQKTSQNQTEVHGRQEYIANTKVVTGYAIFGTLLAISIFFNIGLTVFCLRQSRRIKTLAQSSTAHEMQANSVSREDHSNYEGLDIEKVNRGKNIYDTVGQ